MDYFSPGFREIVRLAQRASWRVHQLVARRQLASAEIRLGLLGWQQADFDADTQRQVDALQNVEREQADLTNRAADFSHQKEAVSAERAKVRADFDLQRGALEAERTLAREPLAEIERSLRAVRERPSDGRQRIAELEKNLREAEALRAKLMGVNPQPSYVRDEIQKLGERIVAIPNEIKDIRTGEQHNANDAVELEQRRKAIEQRSTEFDRQIAELKSQADKRDAEFAGKLKELGREHDRAESASQRLERAKSNPYREIGRVLADSGLAPVNQPDTLTRVLALRDLIAQRESAVAESLQQTRAEDAPMLRVSLIIWTVIACGVLLVVAAIF